MIDSSLAAILTTGGGACAVFCILFITGQIFPKSVVDDLKKERDAERARADANDVRANAGVAAAQATNSLMAALQTGVSMGQQQPPPPQSLPLAPGGHPDAGSASRGRRR